MVMLSIRRAAHRPMALLFALLLLAETFFFGAQSFALLPNAPTRIREPWSCVSPSCRRDHHRDYTTRAALCASTSDDSSSLSCDVAIFGGGFGGLYTALSVARQNPRLDVALVDPSETFVFLPLLYDLAVGTATEAEVCPYYSDLLRHIPSVRHIPARLTQLEARTQTAILDDATNLQFKAAVVAVGATPQSILKNIPGASDYAQPFYTATHAKQTRRLLNRLTEQDQCKSKDTAAATRIAIVGGGFGGVELAASVQRRLKQHNAQVVLLSKGPPMANTRAEAWIDAALRKLGVVVEDCVVQSLSKADDNSKNGGKVTIVRKLHNMDSSMKEFEMVQDEWDAVLWTAGSGPAYPVASQDCAGLQLGPTGRLAVDKTLRCLWEDERQLKEDRAVDPPCLWALGDCAEIVRANQDPEPVPPKTAQVAMQQSETVATNVVAHLKGKKIEAQTFVYQDLGSMLTLGGPNAAVLAPRAGTFAPLLEPVLDTTARVLRVADDMLGAASSRGPALGLPTADELGLSLGSHGLGIPDNASSSGTLAGTLSGAARRAVYAVRMPTNQQKAVSLVSAAIATAAALAKEAAERSNGRSSS